MTGLILSILKTLCHPPNVRIYLCLQACTNFNLKEEFTLDADVIIQFFSEIGKVESR